MGDRGEGIGDSRGRDDSGSPRDDGGGGDRGHRGDRGSSNGRYSGGKDRGDSRKSLSSRRNDVGAGTTGSGVGISYVANLAPGASSGSRKPSRHVAERGK